MTYRDTLYGRYFSTQASAVGAADLALRARWESRILEHELAPWLPESRDAAILELGCGWGSFLQFARQTGYTHVRGIDVSAEQVAQANAQGLDNAEVADAFAYLDAHPAAFDCVVAMDLIEHFSRPEAVRLLQAIHRALRPGGAVLLRTPNADAPFASINVHGDFTHELALNQTSLGQLLASCGFSGVELRGSHVGIEKSWKEALRRAVFPAVQLASQLTLFAWGRSTRVLLTPQLLARAVRA